MSLCVKLIPIDHFQVNSFMTLEICGANPKIIWINLQWHVRCSVRDGAGRERDIVQ